MTSASQTRFLGTGFLDSILRFPDRPALEVDGEAFSYAQLAQRARRIAATLSERGPSSGAALTAVLAHRSISAFAGILGALLRGHGYVPLNPYLPADRTATMLHRSQCRNLVVGEEATEALGDLLERTEQALLVLLPATEDAAALRRAYPGHTFVAAAEISSAQGYCEPGVDPGGTAYLLFTSGSTGIPKGVQVAHQSINRFVDLMVERYGIDENDRFSQMFELGFDLSLFDMFVAWERGACVCCPSKGDAMLPTNYILDSGITIWFSVPSLALAMKKMRAVEPGLYPKLRVSLFCGEALLAEVADAWAAAAPNSIVENLYGPTEVTLACTRYRWDPETSPAQAENGIVPIGEPFEDMTVVVADEQLREVPEGEAGELLMSGPQVAIGYWNDPDETALAFVTPPDRNAIHYRTGDLVRRPAAGEPIVYLGRIDHQIKIRGNRVELGEIEAVLREAASVDIAVAIGWPETPTGADAIVAFLSSEDVDVDAAKRKARAWLPAHMVPRKLYLISEMPLNANGKVDRKALRARLG